MHDHTLEIVSEEEAKKMDAEYRKHLHKIPNDQLPAVQKMNRRQRRAWLSKQRKTKANDFVPR